MDVRLLSAQHRCYQCIRIGCNKALNPACFFFWQLIWQHVPTASSGAKMGTSLLGAIRRRVINRSATELVSLVVYQHGSFTAE